MLVTRSSKRNFSATSAPNDHISRKKSKANDACPKRALTLLTLPYHIRILILKELLLASAPLRDGICLYPAILRTCKTFADDHRSCPYLYRNTFGLDMWIGAEDDGISFLNHTISSDWIMVSRGLSILPGVLLEKVKHVDVEINVDYGDDTVAITEEDSLSHRVDVISLIEPLREFRALQTLSITVKNAHELAEDNSIGNDILDSLKGMRSLHCVTINGVSPTHATEMKAAMESADPAENLHAMVDALRKYLGEEFYEDVDWSDIKYAESLHDVASFKEIREDIVARIEAARTALRLQLYQHDTVLQELE